MIDATALTSETSAVRTFCAATLTVSNVTFDGGGHNGGVLSGGGDASVSNTTFRNSWGSAINRGACTGGANVTFTNILVENVRGVYFNYEDSPTAIRAAESATFIVTNMVVRNHYGGNAAIDAWLGGSITINGCFSHGRIHPQVFGLTHTSGREGTIIDNSTGPCSGTIGNGDPAATNYPPPQPAACGLPSGGEDGEHLSASAVYNLTADCFQTATLFKPAESTITINGNGHTIHAPSDGYAIRTHSGISIISLLRAKFALLVNQNTNSK